MALVTLAVAIAVVPGLLLLLVLAARNQGEDAPVRRALLVYAVSALCVLIVQRVHPIWDTALAPLPANLDIAISTGTLEEGAKLAFLLLLTRGGPRSDRAYARVVLGAAVGLGFAAMENLTWVEVLPGVARITDPVARTFTTMPYHFSAGVIMSFLVMAGHSALGRAARLGLFSAAYLVPVTLHALYIFCALTSADRSYTDVGASAAYALIVYAEIVLITCYAALLIKQMHARPLPGPPPLRRLSPEEPVPPVPAH